MTPNDATEFDIHDGDEDGCGHGPCACPAGESGYCSAHCEAAGDVDDEDDEDLADAVCGCGHADCESEATSLSRTGS